MKQNKSISHFLLLLVCLALAGNRLAAQNIRKLTLDETIDMSVKASGQLKIANAKVTEAIANTKQAWNNQLPDLKATATYMRLNTPTVDLKIKLSSSSSSSKAPSIKVNELSYEMANLSIPVFSGFKIHYGIEAARYLEQATKLDAENQREDIVENAISAYCNLYKAEKTVALVKENLREQDQRVVDFTNKENNGVLALNDLLKAQLQQSNIELTLLDAENNLKLTRINLSLMLGLPESTELESDSTIFQESGDISTIARWEQIAFDSRKDYKSLNVQEKATETSIKMAKGDYYPGLAVTGGYIAANVPGLLSISNALNIGLGLQYNIGSIWKTPAKIDAAKARLVEITAAESLKSDEIRMQVNQAYQNYVLAQRRIGVYQKAIDQAKENYRISKNKYDNALLTVTDLLDADVALLQAQLNLSQSKADAFGAYKKLQHTAGVLSRESK